MTQVPTPHLVVSDLVCRDHPLSSECHYQVAWSINPHMQIGSVDLQQAKTQHAAYVSELEAAGANVTRLPFVHAAYDSVFAKDPALLLQRRGVRRALLASLRYPQRQAERVARADAYARDGFDVVCDDAAPEWEGGDIVMHPAGTAMFLGHGPRSRTDAVAWLERHAEMPVSPLELCDPHLYHLDMALAVLPDGCALVCESALTPQSMKILERAPGIRHVAIVRRSDALAFGLNLVAVRDTILCGANVPRIESLVRARGFELRHVPLDQFHRAGGSAACLVAVVHPDPRPAVPRSIDLGARTMEVYGPLFRSVIKPLWERHVRRRPVMDHLKSLLASQWFSLDQLRALQNSALRTLLQHAHDNVPFYRARFEALGLSPRDIQDAEDLCKVPILRRPELHGRFDRMSTSGPAATISKQTSGTTGEPLLFRFEPESEHWRRAVKMRGYGWAGYQPGDRALHFWGARLPTPPPWTTRMKIALDRRLHRDHYVPCDVMNDERLRETVDLIRRIKPTTLVCYAQAGAELARYVNRNDLRTWQSMSVICGAEQLLPHDRVDLQRAFGPNVFDTYGCREVMLIGAECEAHSGLHVSMENLVVEIVVTENGVQRPAREGETGEVVFTDLHNFAMPFIRYANGDIATAGPTTRCTCGRYLPRLGSVQGRISETLRDGEGAAVSGLAISYLFHDIAGAVRQFQAVQHKDHSVSINVVLHDRSAIPRLEEVQRNGSRLLRGIDVRVNSVIELPRSAAGKHRLVVAER